MQIPSVTDIRQTLKKVVEESSTRTGRVFDYFIQFLIVISVISFSIETLPNLSDDMRRMLRYIEISTITVFTIEYLLRILIADEKSRFIFSTYGLIDIIAILPFYVSTGLDLRAIRAIRLFRLIRVLKLVRYTDALNTFGRAYQIAKNELLLFLFAAVLLFYFAAVGIYYFDNEAQPTVFSSVFLSLWWAVVTLTTVGYGDVYPITSGGRIFTFFVLIVGVSTIAIPSGIVASALGKARENSGSESDNSRTI